MNVIKLKKTVVTVIMLVVGLLFLFPFLWMLSASFKPETEVFKYPMEWIPNKWHAIENYKEVWFGKYNFVLYYLNSIKVAVLTTLISVIVSSAAAYGFSKINFVGRDAAFLIVLVTYMIPQQAILVPQFLLYTLLHLFNNHLGLILLNCFSVLGTFMLRQFFMGIHNDYIEAAKCDGANHLKIFMFIALPVIRPALATYIILRFIWTWNDYQNPLIFIRSETLYTIQLGIRQFSDLNGQFYSLIMAGAVSAIIPLLVIFVVGQKHVIEGISQGGVKG